MKNQSPAQRSAARLRRRIWFFRFIALSLPLLLLLAGEGLVRRVVDLPPTTFFVEERRGNEVWVRDNPSFGYTFFHPAQARLPAQNLFQRDKPDNTLRILVLGESAAMGFPHPEFGLARMLAAHLGTKYPDQPFDVIDGTMTMINSHLLREIALEALTYDPDLVVLYAGNNEVIGPYGAAGVFGAFRPSVRMVRIDRWLRTRSALVRWLTSRRDLRQADLPQWLGLDHFVDTPVLADDPRMRRIYSHFRHNLSDIVEAVERHGAPLALVTPAVNLADWAPLHSFLPNSFSAADRQRWEEYKVAASQAAVDGDLNTAAEAWRSAQALVPGHAETAYRLGVALAELGELNEAMVWFEKACQWDGYRFRADQEIANIVREIAEENRGCTLIDVRPRLSVGQPQEDPIWLEHVHYSVSGMASLVNEIAPVAAQRLGLRETEGIGPAPLLALNMQPDIVEASWSAVQQFLGMQVFQGQAGFAARLDDVSRRRTAAAQQMETVSVEEIQAAHRQALDLAAAPLWLLETLRAGYLERRQAIPQAIEAIEVATSLMPHAAPLQQTRGRILLQAGDFSAALQAFEDANRLNPYMAESLTHIGLIWQHRGARERARSYYEQALAIDPRHAAALNNLGYLHYESGHADLAVDLFRSALTVNPDMLEARYHLGLALLNRGEFENAGLQFAEVVRRQPAFARAWSAWGVAEMQQGNATAAAAQFARAMEEDPDLVEPQVNWIYAQLHLGRYDEALPSLSSLLDNNPDRAEIRYMYARALTGTEQFERAIPEYQRAIRAAPHRTDWMIETARLFLDRSHSSPALRSDARELAELAWMISRETDDAALALLEEIDGARSQADTFDAP